MKITSDSFAADGPIPAEFAFARIDPATHITLSGNRNPQLAWDDAPDATRSFALICVDPDAPTVADHVNKEGEVVPKDLPRADFHHWIMVDMPATCTGIAAGECSDGVVAGGKKSPSNPAGAPDARQGVGDYTSWFAGDPDMGGTYHGYDGPGPPWNDALLHHYNFQLFALDLERCPVEGGFSGSDVRAALEGHVLAQATVTGTYSTNPDLI
jgi:Raf kinase inhibitor-like YbhB/YbcL family protein